MKTLAAIIFLFAQLASADVANVLTLQRTNYKPEKRLYYDVNYNAATCEIDLSKPFDIYYRDNITGEKLDEFSKDSEKYFGAKMNTSVWTTTSVSLDFTALTEVEKATGADVTILVNTHVESGVCTVDAEYTNGSESYLLKHIDIEMKKAFGFPIGVSWVKMMGESIAGPISQCVLGSCN